MNGFFLMASVEVATEAAGTEPVFLWHSFFFMFFAGLACAFSLAVLFSTNIVRMAFYLIMGLCATAGLFFLAGAEFVVSPTTNIDVIRLCRRYDKAVMPGALTPTEVLTAWEAGADVVKVFPSDITGPRYLKDLHGPLPQVRLMPTGGVTLETAADFLRAGACALGIGGSLVESKAVASGDMARIESLADPLVDEIRNLKDGDLKRELAAFVVERRTNVQALNACDRFPRRSIFVSETALTTMHEP